MPEYRIVLTDADPDARTDAAETLLASGDPHKGGRLCPGCDDWTDRHSATEHARTCATLRAMASSPHRGVLTQ